MKKSILIADYKKYVMPTYTRENILVVKAKGSIVEDITGRKYLDFFSGWAVSGLGHTHPDIAKALAAQLKKALHVPNNYYNEWQGKLAKEIVKHSFDGKVFFCNSGAEAVEGAIKLARLWGSGSAKYEIITMNNSFHGRTLSTVAATGQLKYRKGFSPIPKGFVHVTFNDITALKKKITKHTVAIMLELIQGEGGINVATPKYIKEVRAICRKKNLLLIFDEVQTAMGRTAEMFCYQNYGVTPDVMTLAKSLGGGFPIGAIVAKRKIANTLVAGTHASTFGGSPLACVAALAVFKTIGEKKLLTNAKRQGTYLFKKLKQLKEKYPIIKEIRGLGLMLGLDLYQRAAEVYRFCLDKGLLINCTHQTVIRIMPHLEVGKHEIDQAIEILDSALKEVSE